MRRKTQWTVFLFFVLARGAWAGYLSNRTDSAKSGLDASWIMGNSLLWIAVGGAGFIGLLTAMYWWRHRGRAWESRLKPPPGRRLSHGHGRDLESNQFEQILSELQGIKLRIENGEGRGSLPNLLRLTRVFIARAGYPDAREQTADALADALMSSEFTSAQIEVLSSIIGQCETAIHEDTRNLDFDPMDLVADMRRVVYQFEGRDPR